MNSLSENSDHGATFTYSDIVCRNTYTDCITIYGTTYTLIDPVVYVYNPIKASLGLAR